MHNKINQEKLQTQKMMEEIQRAKREERLSVSHSPREKVAGKHSAEEENDETLNLEGDILELQEEKLQMKSQSSES